MGDVLWAVGVKDMEGLLDLRTRQGLTHLSLLDVYFHCQEGEVEEMVVVSSIATLSTQWDGEGATHRKEVHTLGSGPWVQVSPPRNIDCEEYYGWLLSGSPTDVQGHLALVLPWAGGTQVLHHTPSGGSALLQILPDSGSPCPSIAPAWAPMVEPIVPIAGGFRETIHRLGWNR